MTHPYRSITAAALLAVALSANAAVAGDPARGTRALTIEPDAEQRSRIIEVMVHVPMAGKSAEEASEAGRQMAIEAALALATEQLPNVPPAELTVEAVDYREYPVSNGKLPVTLTAEVKEPAAKAPQAKIDLVVDDKTGEVKSGVVFTSSEMAADAPLEVRLWTQNTEFTEGEEMVIRIRGNRDFHGRLLYRDVDGNLMQILPNAYRTEVAFKANTDYVVPGPGDKFRLRVSAPFGEETIILMASTKPLGEIATKDAGNGVLIAEAGLGEVSTKTRALKLEPVAPPAVASASPAPAAAAAPQTPTLASTGETPRIQAAEFVERTLKVTTRAK